MDINVSKIEVLRGPRIEEPPIAVECLSDQRNMSQPKLLRKTKTDVRKSKEKMMRSLRASRQSPKSKENEGSRVELEKRSRRSPVIIKTYDSRENRNS